MRVVIPSVQYADFLSDTLPACRALLPRARITVVTAPHDRETQAIARTHGAGVCVSDVWTRDGAIFNKAAALDVAFGFQPGFTEAPRLGETCLSLDADAYLCGTWPAKGTIRKRTLYGCPRYWCRTPADLVAHRDGLIPRDQLEVILTRARGESIPRTGTSADAAAAARMCLGYFQLFRYTPGIAFGQSKTAGKYDLDVRVHFRRREGLEGLYVLHLGESQRANWRGRVVAPWGMERAS